MQQHLSASLPLIEGIEETKKDDTRRASCSLFHLVLDKVPKSTVEHPHGHARPTSHKACYMLLAIFMLVLSAQRRAGRALFTLWTCAAWCVGPTAEERINYVWLRQCGA